MNNSDFRVLNMWVMFLVSLVLFSCEDFKNPSPVLEVAGGELIRIDSFASKYVDTKCLDIWLPPAYESGERLDVLYMHDGQALFDGTTTWNGQEWGVDEYFMADGAEQKYIIVGVWNAGPNRWTEYFPQKALGYMEEDSLEILNSSGMDTIFDKLSADRYLKFLVEELKPYIDTSFHVNTDREHTAIMGSSMGGLISWYAAMEYPEVFGTALCLSTHWPGIFTNENNPIPGAFRSYIAANLDTSTNTRFYFDTGTAELDSLYLEHQLKVDSIFDAKGFKETNYYSKVFEGAAHNEDYWRSRLEYPFRFLLK